jgi:hypothetical protein
MDIKEQRLTFETAKLSKEKGYDVAGYGYFTKYLKDQIDPEYPEGGGPFSMTKGEIEYDNNYFVNNKSGDFTNESYFMCSAPTQSLLARWLREVHNIQVYVYSHTKDANGKYRDYIANINGKEINDPRDSEFQTYEEAMEFGLYVALTDYIN